MESAFPESRAVELISMIVRISILLSEDKYLIYGGGGGGYSQKNWVGGAAPYPKPLPCLWPKYAISLPYLGPDQKFHILWPDSYIIRGKTFLGGFI